MKKIFFLSTALLLYCSTVSAQYKLETIAGEQCFVPGNQGEIRASLSGGTGPYDVLWPNGTQVVLTLNAPTATLSNLGKGNFDVTFVNQYGCEKVLSTFVADDCSRRMNDFASTIKVFPNPFTDALFLDFESDMEASALLQITDLTGKTVHEETLDMQKGDNQHQIIPKQDIANGIYILSIKVAEQPAYTIKMINE